MEENPTRDIATGVQVGVYNSRGAHYRGEGGGQERALAQTYRSWSRALAFQYAYVSNLLEGIAQRYDREAEMEDLGRRSPQTAYTLKTNIRSLFS